MFIVTSSDAHKILSLDTQLVDLNDTVSIKDIKIFRSLEGAHKWVSNSGLKDLIVAWLSDHF